MIAKEHLLGVDVAKHWLDIFDGSSVRRIDNTPEAITDFINRLPEATYHWAIEPTNRYHFSLVAGVLSAGQLVYLIDAYRLSRYRDAVGVRAKTDSLDAQLLYRYLMVEQTELRPYQPAPESVQSLNDLLRARGKLAREKSTLRQSLSVVDALKEELATVLGSINDAIVSIDNKLLTIIREAGYERDYQRCLAIPGVGPVIATALTALFHRGHFRKADAFIAYMGMDVRVRESGQFRGKRKLTKKGNPEIRRLLFNGARAGARTTYWKSFYTTLRERGLPTTGAHIAVARKIARVAFALLSNKVDFNPKMRGDA